MRSRVATLMSAAALTAIAVFPGAASAHTEADLVAVAAGDQATLTLKPTHGCEGSPTIEVAIQAPVTGATAGEVEGWTATATDDLAAGTTVIEWTGGSLPADATGEFPVEFTVPDNVGELMVFPAIQICEDGQELAWINGDPASDYPAPRILVLAAGSPAATSIDDVAPDAPGRDQLTAIIDVDNPDGSVPEESATVPDSTVSDPSASGDVSPEATVADDGDVATDDAGTGTTADDADSDDDSNTGVIVGVVAMFALVGVIAGFVLSRRKGASRPD